MIFYTQKKELSFYGGSDFHLETEVCKKKFDPKQLMPNIKLNKKSFNICLLAGDISVPSNTSRYTQWFEYFCQQFDLVFYIEGNHENWKSYVGRNFEKLQNATSHISNLIFLSRQNYSFKVNKQEFSIVGATLWSDLCQQIPGTNNTFFNPSIHDYTKIRDLKQIKGLKKGVFSKLRIGEYQLLHDKDYDFIKKESLILSEKHDVYKILMTHHSPILDGLYKYPGHEDWFNVFDATDLSNEIRLGNYNFVLYGHIHRKQSFITYVDHVPVFSNPAGMNTLSDQNSNYSLMKLDAISI